MRAARSRGLDVNDLSEPAIFVGGFLLILRTLCGSVGALLLNSSDLFDDLKPILQVGYDMYSSSLPAGAYIRVRQRDLQSPYHTAHAATKRIWSCHRQSKHDPQEICSI